MSQINAVEAPIINLPYVPPAYHWHIEEGKQPEKRPGRRLASYFFRVPDRAARGRKAKSQQSLLDDASKGQEYLLDLEREGFLRLVGTKKSQERIEFMLKKGKPLRN